MSNTSQIKESNKTTYRLRTLNENQICVEKIIGNIKQMKGTQRTTSRETPWKSYNTKQHP